MTSRGCLITPGCARTRRRPNASRRDVSLVSRLNVYASLVVRQKRTRAPQLPRLHLRRRGLRGLVVEPGPLRVEPAGAHLRGPHVELGVFVLVQAGGVRERLRRRIRLGGERRRLDAVAVACVSFWFFFFRRERVSDGVFSERRLVEREERRSWTVRDAGSGAVGSGPVTRDRETGTRTGSSSAFLSRVSSRETSGRFGRNAPGSARGATGRRGHSSDVRRRDAPATLARPPFVMVCWVSNASPPSPP